MEVYPHLERTVIQVCAFELILLVLILALGSSCVLWASPGLSFEYPAGRVGDPSGAHVQEADVPAVCGRAWVYATFQMGPLNPSPYVDGHPGAAQMLTLGHLQAGKFEPVLRFGLADAFGAGQEQAITPAGDLSQRPEQAYLSASILAGSHERFGPYARPVTPYYFRLQLALDEARLTAWTRARGYSDVYFMGCDEFSGERLRGERDSFEAIHQGGGKIFVACYNDFFDIVGDLLDCPILQHPGNLIVDQHQSGKFSSRDFLLHRQRMVTYDSELMMMPHIQKMIRSVHKNGFKIFSYMDPYGSHPEPEWHRRHRGLGLWKIGLDGTMTWAYTHIYEKARIFGDPKMEENGMGYTAHGFVLRGPKGVLDSLSWEAYREGYDDARYLATLQDAIARAKAGGKHGELVARTERWLDNITVNVDLDAWRLEMARRTEALLKGS